MLAAIGSIDERCVYENGFFSLQYLIENNQDWVFGSLSYDLKNEIENLTSKNIDNLNFPLLHFIIPEFVFTIKENQLEIHYIDNNVDIADIYQDINNTKFTLSGNNNIQLKKRITKEKYIKTVKQLQKHISRGDVYELNYCQEFYNEQVDLDPFKFCSTLWHTSPMPFSVFYRNRDKFLISASPERYLKKLGQNILSQPIKGTAKRSQNTIIDKNFKNELSKSEKERAENIMIVDLVRNDLSKIAKKNTIEVNELCTVYPFPSIYQMISTISAELKNNYSIVDIFKNTFPMGSMTGAPKVKAMELIEKYENTKRGLFSGSVGYITPERDFDFNVVIRSLLYHAQKRYLSFMVGSAITSNSIPEKEYDECLIKAKAMFSVLEKNNAN